MILLDVYLRWICCFGFFGAVLLFFSASAISVRVHTGWKACRLWNYDSNHTCFSVPRLPTTALAVLIQNQQIPGLENLTVSDLYTSRNLERIPDISIVGRDYYSLRYEYDIHPSVCTDPSQQRLTLRIAGINYQAIAFLDQGPLPELGYRNGTEQPPSPPGMFRRRNYNVSPGGHFAVEVRPPYHPGRPVSGSQGGDHALAQDGAIPQYMLGWDWCSSMPDRATGFYGSVHLECTGRFALQDPTVQTLELSFSSDNHTTRNDDHYNFYTRLCKRVKLRILVDIEDGEPDDNGDSQDPFVLNVEADWGEAWQFIIIPNKTSKDPIFKAEILVDKPEKIQLWWPHGLGVPDSHLHKFHFSLFRKKLLMHSVSISAGIRTVETFLDKQIQGQRFRINGADIYLVGGNWIATDQMLRYSASTSRYCNEIALHKHAGLNLLRVWGGGTAERTEFYECADQLGMLVYQEFWMTGDNNGRWAGQYSYPQDYEAYLKNVEDTVKRLRRHPSLLFYGGCNECLAPPSSPWVPNPPRLIDDGIQAILRKYDPGRFYIASSMGGANKADSFVNPSMWYNRSYSLAFGDGPYNMLLPSTFFRRNPGLPVQNVTIGFQPEIGSVGMPTYRGLLRFMHPSDVESGFPRRNQSDAGNSVWEFHKFEPWTTLLDDNETYDHVFAYFESNYDVNASEWVAAAQLALHVQYQNLFNGFISHIFEYTTTVIMWKTQSPWPSLRGFLYDWYLETTGALRGVRASLRCPVSVVFDPSSWRLCIVNRSIQSFRRSFCSLGAEYSWITVHGNVLESRKVKLLHDISAMSALFLGSFDDVLQWPENCSSVCFLRLQIFSNCSIEQANHWYWLTKTSASGDDSDFSLLGQLRQDARARVQVRVHHCHVSTKVLQVQASIYVALDSPVVFFYPTFQLLNQENDPLLPIFDDHECDVVLLPGSESIRNLESPARILAGSQIRVELSSWNAPTMYQDIICQAPRASNEV